MDSKRFALLLLAAALLFASVSCTMWGEKKHANWKSATSGEHVVNLFWSDVKAKDWQNIQAHVGSRFIGMSPSGNIDQEQLIAHLRAMDLQSFQIGELETRVVGIDMIVTYTIAAQGTVNGHPLPSSIRMMSVWQELKNGWVLVANSAIPAN